MRTSRRTHGSSLAGAATFAAMVLAGCSDNAVIPDNPNKVPMADARLIVDGRPIDQSVDGGQDLLVVPLAGEATSVELTLDGTMSEDPDGEIATYRWMSGTVVPDAGTQRLPDDGGTTRAFPPGEDPNWPKDVAKPKVELTEGIWSFNLWVIDDRGAISRPDPIQITVGDVVDPVVVQCSENVLQTVPEACRNCICRIDDTCRTAVMNCGQACWDLISCVGTNCPDYAAMVAMMDYSCLINSCMPLLEAGGSEAVPAGPCVRMCPEECRAMPAM